MRTTFLLVIAGSILAAAGQIFLKLGATGASSLAGFLNSRVLVGFGLYGVGSLLWILALAKLPLTRVYPFTILTFVLVYMASAAVLGEQITGMVLAGAAIVLLGLVLIVLA